tara:strand:- start:57658 stop:57981 length:324 start_codon:yes stop_codon:yes gene_type:complete
MRLLNAILILLLATGCLVKKPEPKDTEPNNENISIVVRGLFTVDSTLYFSNGIDTYCAFDSWNKADYFKGKLGGQEIFKLKELPDSMKFIPVCKLELLIDSEKSLKN